MVAPYPRQTLTLTRTLTLTLTLTLPLPLPRESWHPTLESSTLPSQAAAAAGHAANQASGYHPQATSQAASTSAVVEVEVFEPNPNPRGVLLTGPGAPDCVRITGGVCCPGPGEYVSQAGRAVSRRR